MATAVEPSAARATAGADLPGLPSARPVADGEAEFHYWPCEVLDAFVLQMAKRGHCVNIAMMLGHPPYALEQLDMAHLHHDAELDALVALLQDYFSGTSGAACGAAGSTQTLLRPWPFAS